MTEFETESVGVAFDTKLLVAARDKTREVIQRVASQMKAGSSESDARKMIDELFEAHGYEKCWHPSQIRLGKNTLLSFGKPGAADVRLAENDVFFFDLGPIFEKHEGDVGRSFAIGDDPEMTRICADVATIWNRVRARWFETAETGQQLYRYAEKTARDLGWIMTLESANGHRIADFPHAARNRGDVDKLGFKPAPFKWILEIQIRHPNRSFGAFFEDLLV